MIWKRPLSWLFIWIILILLVQFDWHYLARWHFFVIKPFQWSSTVRIFGNNINIMVDFVLSVYSWFLWRPGLAWGMTQLKGTITSKFCWLNDVPGHSGTFLGLVFPTTPHCCFYFSRSSRVTVCLFLNKSFVFKYVREVRSRLLLNKPFDFKYV